MKINRFLPLLIIFLLTYRPVYGQPNSHNRTERLNGKDVIIADEPLPDAVYQAHFNNIVILINFYEKEKDKDRVALFTAMGNGSFIKPGVVISARHVLSEPFKKIQEQTKKDKEAGITATYSYEIFGIVFPERSEIFRIPLNLRVYSADQADPDIMVLQVPPGTMKDAIESNVQGDFTFKILTLSQKLTDKSDLGTETYTTGTLLSQDGVFRYVFKSEIVSINDIHESVGRGMNKRYTLRGHAEPGYSGGPVFNRNGELIGITVMSSDGYNFTIALSAKDVKDFLDRNNIK